MTSAGFDARAWVGRMVCEPLIQFLVLGGMIFIVHAALAPTALQEDRPLLVVSDVRIDALVARFKGTWGREPTPEERQGLIDDWLREELFLREALAYGLDQGDPVIRARLRQKIEIMAEETGPSAPPTEAEIVAYQSAHPDRYEAAGDFSFRQIALSDSDAGHVAMARAALADGVPPEALTAIALLPVQVAGQPEAVIARDFGPDFVTALRACPLDAWCGPVLSVYASHLVQVTARSASDPDPAAGVALRDRVLRDMDQDRRRAAVAAHFERLKAEHDIHVGGPEPLP